MEGNSILSLQTKGIAGKRIMLLLGLDLPWSLVPFKHSASDAMSFSESGLARIRLCVESLLKVHCSVVPSPSSLMFCCSELSRAPTLPKWHLPSLRCWHCSALTADLPSAQLCKRNTVAALNEPNSKTATEAEAKALLRQGFGLRSAMRRQLQCVQHVQVAPSCLLSSKSARA